ncbi:MAG TPA: uroporphyrinogen-III C-methyltransferase [Woeseiaceae bacterium]|nr:uroporphyrinogen-III C-methyltransferase [Woeseiaceae bacterium]
MSETENPNRNSPVVDADFDEPAQAPGNDDAGRPAPAARRGSGWTASIAWLALFVALAALAGLGYRAFEDFRAGPAEAADAAALAALERDVDAALGTMREAQAELESRLEAAVADAGDERAALEDLQEELEALDDEARVLESLAPRVNAVERSLANLQGISVDARTGFLLAEAEYYMQIANAQLQLAGNPELAALALGQADDRLAQVGDPALTEVRRAVADERAALELMEGPDLAGVTLTLGSLAQVVESLPLAGSRADARRDAAAEGEDGGAFDRAWQSVKNAFSGAFSYTAPAEADRPLLAPDAEPLIRSNLALQLQAARLALLRGEEDLFRQSLEDAERWLETYFDTDSAPVAGALETIGEIRGNYRPIARPDISESLKLLRQHQSLAEPAA